MAWQYSLGMAAVLAVLILVFGRQMLDLHRLSRDLRKNVSDLETHVGTVDRLATTLQERLNDPAAKDPAGGGEAGEPEAADHGHAYRAQPHIEGEDRTPEPAGTTGQVQAAVSTGPSRARRAESDAVYQQLYSRWCTTGERPASMNSVEVVPLRFAGEELVNEYTAPIPVFEDHRQVGEFIRFSSPGSSESLAFPHPEAYYNDRAHRVLFPNLTEAAYTPHLLSEIPPVALRKRMDGKWQKA